MMRATADRLEERLAQVWARVVRAAERAGRDPADVEILPVTKGHPAYTIRLAVEVGLDRVGENRVGEAEEKRRLLGGDGGGRWHMIGHLQRNKASRAAALFDVVESVDSVRLARRLSREVQVLEREPLEVLVQVNASGEATKSGLPAAEAEAAVAEICDLPGLRVTGLMTMAPLTDDEEVLRGTFRETRRALERCAELEGFEPRTLSMGMTNDFELAVEEGSTRLRLGTALLGERPEP